MAFGRSNSLSINTGATNSLLMADLDNVHPSRRALMQGQDQALTSTTPSNQQQSNNATTQPPAAGGSLFGSTTQTSQPSQAGSLFGGTAAAQQQQGGRLFGSNTNISQAPQAGGLFGSSTAQPQQTGGLFGSSQQQSNMPAGQQQQGTSLFGGSLNQPIQQQQPQQQGTGLFGGQPKPSLFGGASTTGATAGGTSLFGGGSSLFGGNAQQNQQSTQRPSLFATTSQQQLQPQQQAPTNQIFGLSASQTSLLGASQYRTTQNPSFAGRLTMGQSSTPAAGQPPGGGPSQGAVKINYDEMRPTTRFADCIDDIKIQLESVDKMIQAQERFCREIESFLPKHGENVNSLAPDVELVKEKGEAAEYALAMDAQGVQIQRDTLKKDTKDFERAQRCVDNLRQPPQYQYSGFGTSSTPDIDVDLVGQYFKPLVLEQQKTLDQYTSNLADVEAHMRVIESSAVAQAQQLAAKRAGMGGNGQQMSSEDTVRELADTLRGFEQSILGAAGVVGSCREGVNELVLGRLGT